MQMVQISRVRIIPLQVPSKAQSLNHWLFSLKVKICLYFLKFLKVEAEPSAMRPLYDTTSSKYLLDTDTLCLEQDSDFWQSL